MSLPAKKAKEAHGPWLWPLILVIVGVVLLLDNFLLLGDFDVMALLPLVLVVAGAQMLLRGDLTPSTEARSFGITRGSVESATVEISSGGIDVEIRALQKEGRLIAGHYAANTRPRLNVQGTYSHLILKREDTPWWAFANWEVGLAQDLPWQFLISTHIGQAQLDLSQLIVHDAVIATGFGDIRLVCPPEALGLIKLHSTLGNIHVVTPPEYNVRIEVKAGRMFNVQANDYRYSNPEPHVFVATEAAADAPLVTVQIHGTFGDAYLT